jgi:hypothetical protein
METIKLPEELFNEIKSYCEKHPINLEFDYRDRLSHKQIEKILETEDGLQDFENDLYEMNIDWIAENEDYYYKEIFNDFEDELTESGLTDSWELRDIFMDYVSISLDIDRLINIDVVALIPVYSNYDCTNSFDTMKDSDYLRQVFKRVSKGVDKNDFMYEHVNGAYGGSLFCFAFKTSLKELVDLKAKIKTGKQVLIPKGTQFGFFSSFQGSGSVFEKTTYQDFKLNIKETGKNYSPEYDRIDIIGDDEQSYNMNDVYGQNDFINEQNIQVN